MTVACIRDDGNGFWEEEMDGWIWTSPAQFSHSDVQPFIHKCVTMTQSKSFSHLMDVKQP